MKPFLSLSTLHQAIHALTFSNQLNFPKADFLQTIPYFVKCISVTAFGVHQHVYGKKRSLKRGSAIWIHYMVTDE